MELLVSMGVFLILLTFTFPLFKATGRQIRGGAMAADLAEKGERVMDFIARRVSLAGFSVSNAGIPHQCDTVATTTSAIIFTNTTGALTDDIAVRYAREADPMVIIAAPVSGAVVPARNAGAVAGFTGDIEAIGKTNVRHLITFDTTNGVFEVRKKTAAGGGIWNLELDRSPGDVNRGTPVLVVREDRLEVKGRDLRLLTRENTCASDSDYHVATVFGQVDALQYQFRDRDGGLLEKITDINDIRAVVISLLIRSEYPDPSHEDTNAVYSVGKEKVPVDPAEKGYHRLLLQRSVEVRNLVFKDI